MTRHRAITYLDELLRIPVLKAHELSPDQLALVSNHRPPVSRPTMLRCLSLEFDSPVTATPFHLYRDPLQRRDHEIAAQLITETLLAWRKRVDKCPQNWRELARFVNEFVGEEWRLMGREMGEGDVARWSGKEYLYGEWWGRLSEEQMRMTEPAFRELAQTPRIHPRIKREILHHICEVISKVQGDGNGSA